MYRRCILLESAGVAEDLERDVLIYIQRQQPKELTAECARTASAGEAEDLERDVLSSQFFQIENSP